ncbi:MAG TPA: hypothetical protein VGV40_00530 [Solirubrobacteraceae bacterium]|nr:hypothetical protein [Solirubrobacteraceae bacterium]
MASRARLLVLLAIAVPGVGLAACGAKEPTTKAETEAVYVDVGELRYQVQTSRQLNANDAADRALLVGVPPEERELAPGETFYGVFMRVENETDRAHPAATSFEIVDTQENVYEPLPLERGNAYAYSLNPPPTAQPMGTLPSANSPAGEGTTGGLLLLYKLPSQALQFRPLELFIKAPGAEAEIALDV